MWDPYDNRFETRTNMNMQRAHYGGDFTRIPEDAEMFRNCKINLP